MREFIPDVNDVAVNHIVTDAEDIVINYFLLHLRVRQGFLFSVCKNAKESRFSSLSEYLNCLIQVFSAANSDNLSCLYNSKVPAISKKHSDVIWIDLKLDMKSLCILENYQTLLGAGMEDIVLRMISLRLLINDSLDVWLAV